MKRSASYILLLIVTSGFISWTIPTDKHFPNDVEVILTKAGNNRSELEKALIYFAEKGDEQML